MGLHFENVAPATLQALGRTLHADATALEVVAALEAAGLRPILLKGRSFATWLYRGGDTRNYVDADLLVDPAEIMQAEAVLGTLGFVHDPLDDIPHDKPWHAHSWTRTADAASVDLHRTLIGAGAPPATVWARLSQEREEVLVQGRALSGLNLYGRALHVCLQAVQDGTRTPKAMTDLNRALAATPDDEWWRVRELAASIGALPGLAVGLRSVPAGEAVAEQLNLPYSSSLDLALRSGDAPSVAVGLNWMLEAPGLLPKVRIIRHKLAPPAAFMRAWSPRARAGGSGALLRAYVWERPAWLVRQALPSIRALRRARRQIEAREPRSGTE